MRDLHIAIIVLLTIVVLAFKFQNLQSVTVEFFAFSMTMPGTLLVVLVYLLGMFTGGSLWSLCSSASTGPTSLAK